MSFQSKAWLILVCLVSYFCLGQAGCQTASDREMTYLRSDVVKLRRDVGDIKQQMGDPTSGSYQGVVRNQAAQQEALVELQEGQQRMESRIEEVRYELASLRQEITNLKLNLISQMEALRATGRTEAAAPMGLPKSAPAAPPPVQMAPATPAPLVPPKTLTVPETPAPSVSAPAPVQPAAPVPAPAATPAKPSEPIDFTKLYDTAYEDYQRQNYGLARNGFEEYLRLFSETDLADNAQYWIGECFYAEGKYEEAAEAFKKVIAKYPSGNKVPRAMLKAGHAYLQLGRNEEASAMFQQVVDAYPLSSEADQAKAKLKKMP